MRASKWRQKEDKRTWSEGELYNPATANGAGGGGGRSTAALWKKRKVLFLSDTKEKKREKEAKGLVADDL